MCRAHFTKVVVVVHGVYSATISNMKRKFKARLARYSAGACALLAPYAGAIRAQWRDVRATLLYATHCVTTLAAALSYAFKNFSNFSSHVLDQKRKRSILSQCPFGVYCSSIASGARCARSL